MALLQWRCAKLLKRENEGGGGGLRHYEEQY